jgi:hypothetical protein
MGTITFEGRPPFELKLQRPPTARSEGETVVAILPVSYPDTLSNELETRLVLTIDQAEHLEAVLHAALVSACVNLRRLHGK